MTEEALRFSRLKLMGKSPAHYRAGYGPETQSKRQGTATHSFLLGSDQAVVMYEGKRDKRVEAYREFCKENPGALILSPKEYGEASRMRDAVQSHPRARELLVGEREHTSYWTTSGHRARGTPDVANERDRRLAELKTTKTAHPDRFPWEVKRYCYHGQLAWYRTGTAKSQGWVPEHHHIIAVESSPPYPVTVFNVLPETIDLGWRCCRAWLERLKVCEDNDYWPGYADGDVDLDLTEDSELMWEEES